MRSRLLAIGDERARVKSELAAQWPLFGTGAAVITAALDLLDNPQELYRQTTDAVRRQLNQVFSTGCISTRTKCDRRHHPRGGPAEHHPRALKAPRRIGLKKDATQPSQWRKTVQVCVQRWNQENAEHPQPPPQQPHRPTTPRRRSASNSPSITSASRDPYTGWPAHWW